MKKQLQNTLYVEDFVQRTNALTVTNLLFVLIIYLVLSAPSPPFNAVLWKMLGLGLETTFPSSLKTEACLLGLAIGGYSNQREIGRQVKETQDLLPICNSCKKKSYKIASMSFGIFSTSCPTSLHDYQDQPTVPPCWYQLYNTSIKDVHTNYQYMSPEDPFLQAIFFYLVPFSPTPKPRRYQLFPPGYPICSFSFSISM